MLTVWFVSVLTSHSKVTSEPTRAFICPGRILVNSGISSGWPTVKVSLTILSPHPYLFVNDG